MLFPHELYYLTENILHALVVIIFMTIVKQVYFYSKVTSEMVIHAQSPLSVMTDLHEKFVLVIGQEHAQEIAKEYPLSRDAQNVIMRIRFMSLLICDFI